MENSARIYNCAGCRCQVVICRHCDRGNIYCGPQCSQPARRQSQRAAGRRYQSSRRGRFRHAARQRCYRFRRRKVTHQGSIDSPADVLLSAESRVVAAHSGATPLTVAQGLHCHMCKRLCSPFVRLDFLYSPGPRLTRTPWTRP
jgi:hypothetical protein